jgi:hypothetical protein
MSQLVSRRQDRVSARETRTHSDIREGNSRTGTCPREAESYYRGTRGDQIRDTAPVGPRSSDDLTARRLLNLALL